MKLSSSHILDISPYVPGDAKTSDSVPSVIKLSSNENPFGPGKKAVEAMEEALKTAHRYPDGGAVALHAALAAHYGIYPEKIVCGAGSDEIISLLCYAFCQNGDEVLYTEHGFLMYPIAAMAAGATPVKAPETDLQTDISTLLAAVTPKTRMVFLANPNNPTGSYITHEAILSLRAGLPEDVLLVIDGAYAEYVDEEAYSSGLELVDTHVNIVATRTFSKLYGLGGLRVGWCYADSSIVDILQRVRGPFNVSNVAQAAAVAALKDTAHIEHSKAHNQKWLAQYRQALTALPLHCYPSVANFILVGFPEENGRTAKEADLFLRSQGIITRNVSAYGLPHCLRITLGTDSENQAVIDGLHQFLT